MAIVYSILAILAVVSAIGSASKVQRKHAARSAAAAPAKAAQSGAAAVASAAEPAPTVPPVEPPADKLPVEKLPAPPEAIDPQPANPVAEELVESVMEMMPDVPLAASLLVSEVVNPEANELGVQLDRPNLPSSNPEPAHHSTNLLVEIAELEAGAGDRVAHLSQFVEHPDSVMRVSAAYALGELAAQTQGADQEAAIAVLVRLSQDVDPQVRVQAASALGSINHSAIEG